MGQGLPTIVERHDRNSGRRPVEQVSADCLVYSHLSLELHLAYDVSNGLELASEHSASFL